MLNFVKGVKQERIDRKYFDLQTRKYRRKLIFTGYDFLICESFYFLRILIFIQDFITEIILFSTIMIRTCLLFCLGMVISHASIAQPKISLRDFDFLKGNWSMNTSTGRIVESWKWNNDSGMDGISYSISSKGDSTLLETIKLYESNGNIYYEPTGNGAGNDSTVSFRLISANQGVYVFENIYHDFPQKISYQLQSQNNILAWIEGIVNGNFRKIEFPYSRDKYD